MSERFYLPAELRGSVTLDGTEAHHLSHVMRCGPGDEVVLFDGRGTEADARVEAVSKRGVSLSILRARTTEPDGPPRLVLATAVPKGDRFRWLVEKATELGVDRLVPLETERSVVDPRETKLDKMRQAVVAASKQCGRNRLMEIAPTVAWNEFLATAMAEGSVIVADGTGREIGEVDGSVVERRPMFVAIGPEGGWTANEVAAGVEAGAVFVRLGAWTMRTETAAIAAAAILLPRLYQIRQQPWGV